MIRLFPLVFFLCLSQTVFADAPEGYPFVSFDEAMTRAVAEGMPVFVYFGRYGCGYCEKTNKEAFSDPVVRKSYTRNYVLAYVDAESGRRLRLPSGERITEHELGTRYKAFVTPVFTFLDATGEVLHRLVGVQGSKELLQADQTVQRQLAGEDS